MRLVLVRVAVLAARAPVLTSHAFAQASKSPKLLLQRRCCLRALQANLVIKYNTTFEDAVAGARPKNGELSLR